MKSILTVVFRLTVTVAFFLAFSCGGGKGEVPLPVKVPNSESPRAGEIAVPSHLPPAFTPEDYRIIEMPYEERVAYLEKKLKELVWEEHGIRITESAVGAKGVSDKDSPGHMVEENDQPLNPTPRYNRTIWESLKLTRVANEWRWNLSFLERVAGDYNRDGAVTVLDLTPLAVYFNDSWKDPDGDGPEPEQWPDDYDPHFDRVSNEDGTINIMEITPLAAHFGLSISGYKVWWQRGEGAERLIAEQSEGILTDC